MQKKYLLSPRTQGFQTASNPLELLIRLSVLFRGGGEIHELELLDRLRHKQLPLTLSTSPALNPNFAKNIDEKRGRIPNRLLLLMGIEAHERLLERILGIMGRRAATDEASQKQAAEFIQLIHHRSYYCNLRLECNLRLDPNADKG